MGSWFVVDVEADGPIPSKYSMVSLGVVKVDGDLKTRFYGEIRPTSNNYNPDALAISGFSREDHEEFRHPKIVMEELALWLKENSKGKPTMLSDNIAFDWQWINYYFHLYLGYNPFGYSGRRIGDLYCGMVNDTFARWKHLRDTEANHNPVQDALGNAEVLNKMKKMGLNIPK